MLKPLPVAGPFKSAALNLVIHCLPGPLERKAHAVANVAAVLAPRASCSAPRSWAVWRSEPRKPKFLTVFNRQGGFQN